MQRMGLPQELHPLSLCPQGWIVQELQTKSDYQTEMALIAVCLMKSRRLAW